MAVRKMLRAAEAPTPAHRGLIRKTRLMSKGGVLLVRVETFDDGVLRSTHLKLITPAASETFTDVDRALEAFRVILRRPAERPRLKTAA